MWWGEWPAALHQRAGYGRGGEGRPFDEGELKGVGRRFGSTPTGCGRAMDGDARSGSSVGGGRRPQVGQAGPNGQISRAGKEKFREKEKKNKRAAREFWAGLILGCDEKKKKIFGFWFKEWYSNLNFKYFQTEFELDF
jgi:hypothetical protein